LKGVVSLVGYTKLHGINETLKSTSVNWTTGGTAARTVEVPFGRNRPVMVALNGNTTGALILTVGFQFSVGSTWLDWYDENGASMSFTATAAASTSHRGVFGPFDGFPRFDGGRLTLATTAASTDAVINVVVQEV